METNKTTIANLSEILERYAREGDTFYSVAHGEVTFDAVTKDRKIRMWDADGNSVVFNQYGEINTHGETILFPQGQDWSEYVKKHQEILPPFRLGQHVTDGKHLGVTTAYDHFQKVGDGIECYKVKWLTGNNSEEGWNDNNLKALERFDPSTLHPFDKVLVSNEGEWQANFFYRLQDGAISKYVTIGGDVWKHCVPYNKETAYLLGKIGVKASQFYQ